MNKELKKMSSSRKRKEAEPIQECILVDRLDDTRARYLLLDVPEDIAQELTRDKPISKRNQPIPKRFALVPGYTIQLLRSFDSYCPTIGFGGSYAYLYTYAFLYEQNEQDKTTTILGFILYTMTKSSTLYIDRFCISQEIQGRGFGCLMYAAFEWAARAFLATSASLKIELD